MFDNKLILTDCDGVLLDWDKVFVEWMEQRGYKQRRDDVYGVAARFGLDKKLSRILSAQFNTSAAIRYLPPIEGAVEAVHNLVDRGYRFRVITSLSKDPWAVRAREENLRAVFGGCVFEQILCLDTGADKDEALEYYAQSGIPWIEDKPENALVGAQLGLYPILLERKHTIDYNNPLISKARNWQEIITMVE